MKASELIIKLASLIKKHGDQKVTMLTSTSNGEVNILDVLGDDFSFTLYDYK